MCGSVKIDLSTHGLGNTELIDYVRTGQEHNQGASNMHDGRFCIFLWKRLSMLEAWPSPECSSTGGYNTGKIQMEISALHLDTT